MSRKYIAIMITTGLGLLLIGGTIAINISESLPVGIYMQTTPKQIKSGDIILFYSETINQTAAKRGYIKPGSQLGKRVLAVGGDNLQTGEKTIINGEVVSSKIQQKDSQKRPMEIFQFEGIVPSGKIFVLGDTPGSYDSRYYGFVNESDINKKLKPLWVWNAQK